MARKNFFWINQTVNLSQKNSYGGMDLDGFCLTY